MEFIKLLATHETLNTMSASDKFMAGLMVAVIGMAITFLALIFLMLMIKVLSNLVGTKPKAAAQPAAKAAPVPVKAQEDDLELVAVITAALAASLGKPANQIVVKNIVRVPDTKPTWARLGLTEQINQQL